MKNKPLSSPNTSEATLWHGSPSPIIHAGVYAVCLLFVWLIVPIGVALYYWLEARCTRYTLTTERLLVRQGILSRTTDELELFRVRDIREEQPLWLRLWGLSNLTVYSSDYTNRSLTLYGIANAQTVRNLIRENARNTLQNANVWRVVEE